MSDWRLRLPTTYRGRVRFTWANIWFQVVLIGFDLAVVRGYLGGFLAGVSSFAIWTNSRALRSYRDTEFWRIVRHSYDPPEGQ